MSVRFRLCLAAWIAVIGFSKLADAEVFEFESGWKMEITPAAKVLRAQAAATPNKPAAVLKSKGVEPAGRERRAAVPKRNKASLTVLLADENAPVLSETDEVTGDAAVVEEVVVDEADAGEHAAVVGEGVVDESAHQDLHEHEHDVLTLSSGDEPVIIATERATATGPEADHEAVEAAAIYRHIYSRIPFIRAEYNANPSYRHDTVMELLTGNARHQTTVQHSTQPAAPRPPVGPINAIPYRYNNPAWGLNYYFYFPYWNYRGIY